MPNPFVAVGPGRCGTLSLAAILHASPAVHCMHESVRPVYGDNRTLVPLVLDLVTDFSTVVGESSHLITPHLAFMRSAIPGLKVVRLHRPKEEVVRSWMSRPLSEFSPFIAEHAEALENYVLVDAKARCAVYPKYDLKTPEECWSRWYDECSAAMDAVDGPVFDMDVADLSGDLTALLDFVGVPDDARQPCIDSKRKFSYE